MINLGPVSDAAHGGQVSPWLLITTGSFVLALGWGKHLTREAGKRTHPGELWGVSAICAVFIGIGLWKLFR